MWLHVLASNVRQCTVIVVLVGVLVVCLDKCEHSNKTPTQAATPQQHRCITMGTPPCFERNRLRPPSHETYPGDLSETLPKELAEDDSSLKQSLDPEDGFADGGQEVDARDDINDQDADRPVQELVDDEYFGPDSDEEDDDDPLVQEIKRASKKRQLYVVRGGAFMLGMIADVIDDG